MVKQINALKNSTSALRLAVVLYVLLFTVGGCRQDYSLSPPADSEKITVTVKLPKELKTETMWVMYRSATCKRVSSGASGQRLEQDGHHSIYKEFERQGESDLYQVELPKDGGGACRWHLANVTFGVVYADPARFGENVIDGGGRRCSCDIRLQQLAARRSKHKGRWGFGATEGLLSLVK